MTIPQPLLAKYLVNPLALDEEVRLSLNIPDNRYYTVSVWPENRAGTVYITKLTREVKAKKISKSDQKSNE